jgi:hypothetical protein
MFCDHIGNKSIPLRVVDLILPRCVSDGLLLKKRQHLSLTDISGYDDRVKRRKPDANSFRLIQSTVRMPILSGRRLKPALLLAR